MPRRARAKKIVPPPDEEEDLEVEEKTRAKGLPDDSEEDLMLAMMMKDANFAKIYLASELGARKAIKELLMMMNSQGDKSSSLDDVIKMYLLRKWQKEEEMNKMLMPIILQTLTKISLQMQVQQCVNQKMMAYIMNGMDPLTAMQRANEECQAIANTSADLMGLLGTLGSSVNSNITTASQSGSEPSESSESEQPSEEELEAV